MKSLLLLLLLFCAALTNAQTPVAENPYAKPVERFTIENYDSTKVDAVVKVKFKVDEQGKVIFAKFVSGKGQYKGFERESEKTVSEMHFTPCAPPAKCKNTGYITIKYKIEPKM